MSIRSPLPLILALLALLFGVVAGPAWFWFRGAALISAAQAIRRQASEAKIARAKSWDFWTVAIDNLTSELKEQKESLSRRSDELDQRAARLDAEKQELDQVRSDLEAMQRDIDARVVTIDANEAKNLKTLAQTYTNLTAQSTVAIFKEMDDTTAVKILSLMKPDVVAQIFEVMASSGDESLARRAAILSDNIRLMQSAPPAPPPGG